MAYINGIGVIVSQDTAEGIPAQPVDIRSEYMHCLEPDYKQFINPIAARRMSRLIKLGITAARKAVADAGTEMPGAIITGTGLGSVEDTEKLLAEMQAGHAIVNPTPFIQSTYNTISSQIAINLKCHHYNSTYVNRATSFESALLDGVMQIEEGMADTVLAGGIDEMTMTHLGIIRRTGQWKRQPVSNLDLLRDTQPGALAGEGAAYFLIGSAPSGRCYAKIEAIETLFPSPAGPLDDRQVSQWLESCGTSPDEIGLLVMGYNGDKSFDLLYDGLAESIFPGKPVAWFKALSGEYYTSSAIGLWMAATILRSGAVPSWYLVKGPAPDRPRKILLYNQYRGESHSLVLLSAV